MNGCSGQCECLISAAIVCLSIDYIIIFAVFIFSLCRMETRMTSPTFTKSLLFTVLDCKAGHCQLGNLSRLVFNKNKNKTKQNKTKTKNMYLKITLGSVNKTSRNEHAELRLVVRQRNVASCLSASSSDASIGQWSIQKRR